MVVVAKIKAKSGSEEQMEKVFLELLPKVETEEGTLEYRLHKAANDPTVFFFIESYTGPDALAAHSSSDHFVEMFGQIADLLDGDPEITMLEELGRIKR